MIDLTMIACIATGFALLAGYARSAPGCEDAP